MGKPSQLMLYKEIQQVLIKMCQSEEEKLVAHTEAKRHNKINKT